MRRLLHLSSAAAFACLASLYLPTKAPWILGACFLLSYFVIRRGALRWEGASLIVLGLSIGFLWFSAYSALFYLPAQNLENKTIRLEARVTNWPEATDHGISVPVRGGEAEGPSVPMLMYLDSSFAGLQPGDQIQTISHLRSSSDVNGKQVFHFRAKGIYLFAQSYGAVTVRKADGLSPRYYPAYAAKEIRDTIHTLYSKEASALLCALLTGYKGGSNG